MCQLDFDPCDIFAYTPVKAAKKDHVCTMCDGLIRAGLSYHRHFNLFDGHVTTGKVCDSCMVTIGRYKEAHDGAQWSPDGMEQALEDCIEQELDEREDGYAKRVRMWRGELRNMERRKETRKRKIAAIGSPIGWMP